MSAYHTRLWHGGVFCCDWTVMVPIMSAYHTRLWRRLRRKRRCAMCANHVGISHPVVASNGFHVRFLLVCQSCRHITPGCGFQPAVKYRIMLVPIMSAYHTRLWLPQPETKKTLMPQAKKCEPQCSQYSCCNTSIDSRYMPYSLVGKRSPTTSAQKLLLTTESDMQNDPRCQAHRRGRHIPRVPAPYRCICTYHTSDAKEVKDLQDYLLPGQILQR